MGTRDMSQNRWVLTNLPTFSPENPPSSFSLPLFPMIYRTQESISRVIPIWALQFPNAWLS